MARFSLPRLLFYNHTASHSPSTFHLRHFSAACTNYSNEQQLRNIWISGLVDPAKSPVSERYMLYTGQIEKMEEARNKIQRRETRLRWDIHEEEWLNSSYGRSSTRKSSYPTQICDSIPADVTFFNWKHHKMSVIDTPDHVDFTAEVQNALRAFDAAVLVLSSVGGVNSQSISVDKQMIKYQLPRLVYINNLDQKGANPWQVLNQARSKLQHHCAAIQVPIGLEDDFKGLVDLVQLKAYYFHGEKVVVEEVPAHMEALVSEKRHQLIVTVAHRDTELASAFCRDRPISADELQEAIRRATISLVFMPIFIGSASKYKGLQLLLDGVLNYLPRPVVTKNYVRNQYNRGEKPTLVALTFTLKRKYGQITYLRIYEGVIRKGDLITDVNTGKTFEVPHLYQRRNDELEVIPEAHAGEMVTLYERCIDDVDYASGSTFTDGFVRYAITSESVSKDSVDRSESALREFEKICRELKFNLFESASINDIYFPLQGSIEDYINYARSFEKHFKREEVKDPTVEARV